jgi:hypothetical protein
MPEGKGRGVHAPPGFIYRSPGFIEPMAHAWHTGEKKRATRRIRTGDLLPRK